MAGLEASEPASETELPSASIPATLPVLINPLSERRVDGATTAPVGMLPAQRASRVASALTLRGVASAQPDGRTPGRAWRMRRGDGGVIVQVALSLVLIGAAALDAWLRAPRASRIDPWTVLPDR